MSDLKTLKDFTEAGMSLDSGVHLSVNPKKLKAEAIKWVKELNKYKEKHEKVLRGEERELGGLMMEVDWEESSEQYGIIKFLKHFANITKEDLK